MKERPCMLQSLTQDVGEGGWYRIKFIRVAQNSTRDRKPTTVSAFPRQTEMKRLWSSVSKATNLLLAATTTVDVITAEEGHLRVRCPKAVTPLCAHPLMSRRQVNICWLSKNNQPLQFFMEAHKKKNQGSYFHWLERRWKWHHARTGN